MLPAVRQVTGSQQFGKERVHAAGANARVAGELIPPLGRADVVHEFQCDCESRFGASGCHGRNLPDIWLKKLRAMHAAVAR